MKCKKKAVLGCKCTVCFKFYKPAKHQKGDICPSCWIKDWEQEYIKSKTCKWCGKRQMLPEMLKDNYCQICVRRYELLKRVHEAQDIDEFYKKLM